MAVYRSALRNRYDEHRYDQNVEVCAAGVSVDRLLGYDADNYLHPNRVGYEAMAEAFYVHLNALYCMETHSTGLGHAINHMPALQFRVYPNPFNPSVTINYNLDRPGWVKVAVYDLKGRCVSILEDGLLPAGDHASLWNGTSTDGRPVASGTYQLRGFVNGRARSRNMTLVR